MGFASPRFFLFVSCVLGGYYVLRHRWQNRWLLVASCILYGAWDFRFLALLLASACINFKTGLLVAPGSAMPARRWVLTGTIANSLGLLAVFKYWGFFASSLAELVACFGIQTDLRFVRLVLPVGLSFYTFQLVAYNVDVYRGSLAPCRRLETFLLFTCFFPYLVAGPIPRASALLPQFEAPRVLDWDHVRLGAFLVSLGLFKKVAVANAIAPYVGTRFASPTLCGSLDLVFTLACYSVQIYCDFSGYSDVARGLGKLLGFDLPVNFRQPYLSGSIAEFWQRWHISLSSWFRDYLFLPVNYAFLRRVPEWRFMGLTEEYWSYVCSSILTMTVCGLWHGSQWTFVLWGAGHGMLLSGHRILVRLKRPKRRHRQPALAMFALSAKRAACFAVVTLMWIPFRAPDLAGAWMYLTALFEWRSSAAVAMASPMEVARFAILGGMVAAVDALQRRTGDEAFLARFAWPVRGLAYATFALTLLLIGGVDAEAPFIYFQF